MIPSTHTRLQQLSTHNQPLHFSPNQKTLNQIWHVTYYLHFFAPLQNVDDNTVLPATYRHHQQNPFYRLRPLNLHFPSPPPETLQVALS